MSALYPLVYRESWTRQSIAAAVSNLAAAHGFDCFRMSGDLHEDDADRIIADVIRSHSITNVVACRRLLAQRPLLLDEYLRTEYHWSGSLGEIILVMAESNVIPFPSPVVKTSGEFLFGCGFLDFDVLDRDIADRGIDAELERLLPNCFLCG